MGRGRGGWENKLKHRGGDNDIRPGTKMNGACLTSEFDHLSDHLALVGGHVVGEAHVLARIPGTARPLDYQPRALEPSAGGVGDHLPVSGPSQGVCVCMYIERDDNNRQG